MYLTYNEGNSVAAERFIKNLKNKVYKHVTAVSKKFILMFYMILLKITITHFIEQLGLNQLMLNLISTLNTMLIFMKKILNLKLVIM